MSRVKPIKCPEGFGGCEKICIEVGRAIGYPKELYNDPKRTYHEYRYVCSGCGKEFIYDTYDRGIFRVPPSSQFKIKIRNGEEVISTADQGVIQDLGLESEKIELPAGEFERLLKERYSQ